MIIEKEYFEEMIRDEKESEENEANDGRKQEMSEVTKEFKE